MISIESTLSASSWLMMLTGLCTIVAVYLISAPYGRYSPSQQRTNINWGFLVPPKIAWFIMESPNLWMMGLVFVIAKSFNLCIIYGSEKGDSYLPNLILIICFLTHYINRSVIYPLQMQGGNSMPISVMLLAFAYCSWNGFNQAVSLLVVTKYPVGWIFSIQFILGIALFICSFYINISSDKYLLSLKKEKSLNSYSIPHGGLFELISCPNYCEDYCKY